MTPSVGTFSVDRVSSEAQILVLMVTVLPQLCLLNPFTPADTRVMIPRQNFPALLNCLPFSLLSDRKTLFLRSTYLPLSYAITFTFSLNLEHLTTVSI